MDSRQIELVERSFARAARIGPHVAATFYAELFAIDPAIKPMFKGDIIVQGEKLMRTLEFVVAGLRAPETILPAARALAVKHLDYGVQARHYAQAGTALLRTLKHELGDAMCAETKSAWAAAYRLISGAMLEAAYPQSAGPAR